MRLGLRGLAVALGALLPLVSPPDLAAQTRGVSVKVRASEAATAPVVEEVRLYGKSHALVIGIDDYGAGWPRLGMAVEDARVVAEELRRRGFEVDVKTDLDSFELQQTLKEFFAIKGADPEARLLLWYAGHGHTLNGEGFLVPADAPPANDPLFKVRALHMRDFGGLMRLAEAKHVLSVFDSCFSGTIFQARAGAAPAAITRKTTRPVRQFITSGDAGQQVRDDGSFREYFLRALRGDEKADFNGDGYVTGEELGLFLNQRVTSLTQAAQTPKAGKLHDVRFNAGDFVFVLPDSVAGTTPPPSVTPPQPSQDAAFELAFWDSIKNSTNPADYQAYLQTYPNGRFAALARVRAGQGTQQAALTPAAAEAGTAAPDDLTAEAERIERAVLSSLGDVLASFRVALQLRSGEPARAEVEGDRVLLRFRGARLRFETGEALELGDLALAVTPRGGGTYDFSLDLPNRLRAIEPGGAPVGVFDIASGRVTGRWMAELRAVTKLNIELGAVVVTNIEVRPALTLLRLGDLKLTLSLEEGARGRWDGPLSLRMSGLRFDEDGNGRDVFQVGQFGLRGRIEGVELRGLRQFYASIDPSMGLAPEDTLLLASFLKMPDWARLSFNADLARLEFRERGQAVLAVDAGRAKADIDGRSDLARATASLDLSGLVAVDTDLPPELVPRRGSLDIGVQRFPLRALLAATLPDPALAVRGEWRPSPLAADPEKAIIQARPEIGLNELSLEADALSLSAEGEGVISPDSPLGMVGSGFVRAERVDSAIRAAERFYDRNPGLLDTLSELAGIGRPLTQAGGFPPLGYNVTVTPQDGVVVNGEPLQ